MELETREYYDLDELLSKVSGAFWNNLDDATLAKLYKAFTGNELNASLLAVVDEANAKALWSDHFVRRLDDAWLCYSVGGETEDEALAKWLEKAIDYIVRTAPAHIQVLASYATQKAKLLDPIKNHTTTSTTDNQMPISVVDSQDHASALGNMTGDSADDGATPMARLDEIQRLYSNELDRWGNDMVAKLTFER